MRELAVDQLKAIAHPLRFRILEVLSQGELNVGEVERISGVGQPALSQQLSVLRNAQLVDTRKQAKLVFYRINRETLTETVSSLHGLVPLDEDAQPASSSASGVANFARLFAS